MKYEKYLRNFVIKGNFDEKFISKVEDKFDIKLPEDYLEFMRYCNGGDGDIGASYIRFKSIKEIIDFNKDYEVQAFLPRYIMFADDGGEETFGIYYHDNKCEYIMVSFIFDEDDIIVQGKTFE